MTNHFSSSLLRAKHVSILLPEYMHVVFIPKPEERPSDSPASFASPASNIYIYIYVKKPPDSHNSQKNHFDACIVDNLKIDELVYQNFHQTLNL